jgi:hypothetical protein
MPTTLRFLFLILLGLFGLQPVAYTYDAIGFISLAEHCTYVPTAHNQAASADFAAFVTLSLDRDRADSASQVNLCPTATSLAAESGGDYLVYQSINPETGEVQYVGITSNFEAREAAHLAGNNGSGVSFQIAAIDGLDSLSMEDAKAAEQYLIDSYGLGKNNGSLLNKINSISPTSDPEYYINSIFRGQELLKQAGYALPK